MWLKLQRVHYEWRTNLPSKGKGLAYLTLVTMKNVENLAITLFKTTISWNACFVRDIL